MQSLLTQISAPSIVHCRIAARACLRATPELIAQYRRQTIVHNSKQMPVSILKHAEDQSVLAVHAVLAAIATAGWQDRAFTDWGVLAAPNQFGRIMVAQTAERFRTEGAWCVSPHLIPHESVHAVSGTISQALAIHGPNFGVGGGPESGAEIFLLAGALASDLPGVWVVLTAHESEWLPEMGRTPPAPVCRAIALALMAESSSTTGPNLRIGGIASDADPALEFDSFTDGVYRGKGRWRLGDRHCVEIDAEAQP